MRRVGWECGDFASGKKFLSTVCIGGDERCVSVIEAKPDVRGVARQASWFVAGQLGRFLARLAERLVVVAIKTLLDERDREELPKAPLREGVNYLRNRWESFERFLQDGAIPIDNNRTESMIKGPVMGKKAWLFLGNESAGKTAAVLYTLTMTCKRHSIDVHRFRR